MILLSKTTRRTFSVCVLFAAKCENVGYTILGKKRSRDIVSESGITSLNNLEID